MVKIALIGLGLLLIAPSAFWDQTAKLEILDINGVEFRLGMEQASVFQKLKDRNLAVWKWTPADSPLSPDASGSWVVCDSAPEEGECRTARGQVSFRNGRLELVTKRWAETSNAAEVAMAIYGAVKDLEKRGLTQCQWRAGENTLPHQNNQYVNIFCGNHMGLIIGLSSEVNAPSLVFVDQALGNIWNKN